MTPAEYYAEEHRALLAASSTSLANTVRNRHNPDCVCGTDEAPERSRVMSTPKEPIVVTATDAVIAARTKAVELAVQMWCTPTATDFNVTNSASQLEVYILEGKVASR